MESGFPLWPITVTAFLCAAGFCGALWRYRDTLHPLTYLMPMAAFIYVYMPLDATCRMMLSTCFSREQIHLVQVINFLSIAALIAGCVLGSSPPRRQHRLAGRGAADQAFARSEAERLTTLGLVLGITALVAYGSNIYFQGGFVKVYSQVKGSFGVGTQSGYFRDPAFLAVSAALLLLLGAARQKQVFWHYIGVGVFVAPLLIQGLLQSRRGPAFMGLVAVGAGWYLANGKRPRLVTLLLGGGAIGVLLLALLAFRNEIHLGSDILSRVSVKGVREGINEHLSKETTGNEAFYGANVILSSRHSERHYWGKRFATIVFIRPIPKQWWPTKYEDVGMSDYIENVGLGYGDQLLADVPSGAATGFAADLYLEFAWAGLAVCGAIGWYFGRSWRKACGGDSFAIINYGCLAAFSIFFVSQSIEALLTRYLVVIVPTAILWRLIVHRQRPQQSGPRTRRNRLVRPTQPTTHALP